MGYSFESKGDYESNNKVLEADKLAMFFHGSVVAHPSVTING